MLFRSAAFHYYYPGPEAKKKAMAAVSHLNPVASPFTPMALLPAGYYPSHPAIAIPAVDFFSPRFLYPPPTPPLPPAYGWPVAYGGSWCPSGGFTEGVPAFPLPPPFTVYYCTPPPPPSATRCRITEILEEGGEVAAKGEVRDEP